MLLTTELDMATSVEPSDIDVFITNAAWTICSAYHTELKASPGAAIFGRTCCLTSPCLPTGTKLENTGNAKLTKTWNEKIAHVAIGIINLVIKYFLEKMVSSAKVKVGMKAILGLSHQFI